MYVCCDHWYPTEIQGNIIPFGGDHCQPGVHSQQSQSDKTKVCSVYATEHVKDLFPLVSFVEEFPSTWTQNTTAFDWQINYQGFQTMHFALFKI